MMQIKKTMVVMLLAGDDEGNDANKCVDERADDDKN